MIKELIKNEKRITIIDQDELDINLLSPIVNVDLETLKLWHSWYYIDGVWQYFKQSMHLKGFFNELMGEQIAKYFNIDTVHYELAYLNKIYDPNIKPHDGYNYGVISKNFREYDKKYFTSKELGIPQGVTGINNLTNKRIRKLFFNEEDYYVTIEKIIKMVILDFYMKQGDRRNCNFNFSIDKQKHIDFCPLYDYEHSFLQYEEMYENAILYFNMDDKKIRNYVRGNFTMQKQLYELMDIDIKSIINFVKEYYELEKPQDIENMYIKNDEKMKEKVKTYKLLK